MAQDPRGDEWVPVLVSVYSYTKAAVVVLADKPGPLGPVSLPAKLTYLQMLSVDRLGDPHLDKCVMVTDMLADQRADSMHCRCIAWLPRYIVTDRNLVPMGPVVAS
jgi:hypothetical protein